MTKLFQDYPQIEYKQLGRNFFVKDLTRRAVFFDDIKKDFTIVAEYRIEEGETPTSLAQDFYDNPELFWTILYINNIVDPFFDWPMDYFNLQQWIDNTFQSPDDIQFYTFDGIKYETEIQVQALMDSLNVETEEELINKAGVLAITTRMAQEQINNDKRNIIVIRPDQISQVINAFKESMSN